MTLRVYVAASSAPDQMARAHAVSERLRDAGVELTSMWISNIADVGDANPRDATRELRAQWADECLVGVEQADVVLLLVPPPNSPTKGAWIEFGYATARDKRVIASGDTASTIFLGIEHVTEVSDDDAAIVAVLSIVLRASIAGEVEADEADRAEIAAQLRADGGDPL